MNSPLSSTPWDYGGEAGGPSNSAPQQPRISLPNLDPSWISLDTIQTWLTACNEKHQCAEYPKFGSPPTWLIDVKQECLVSPAQLPGDVRYCALSYVWGQVKTSKLTTATRHAFCQPGAFSIDSGNGVVIPKTIRHAMGLVKALGETYLWVDSFCVVQDDERNFHVELKNMSAIYDRAYLTIVAATAWDADDGICGLRGISRRRHVAGNFADDLNKFTDPDCMIWNSRGWTFQEGQFSRRMIMFCDQTIIWKCLCTIMNEVGDSLAAESSLGNALAGGNLLLRGDPRWRDGLNREGKTPKRPLKIKRKFKFLASFRKIAPEVYQPLEVKFHGPNTGEVARGLFAQYCVMIVNPYNTRNFTQASDLPRAFEGLAQALTQNAAPGTLFSQGLCWGLPIAYLPHVLTWCPDEENLRPRDPALGFPSWSWMAWEGNISPEREPHGRLAFDSELDPVPMCVWDIVYPSPRSKSSHSSVPIPSSAPRTAIQIEGEMCRVGAEGWAYQPPKEPGRGTGYYRAIFDGSTAFMSSNLVALFPDQADEMTKQSVKSVELLGISTFHARHWNAEPTGEPRPTWASRYVKALWVGRSDEAPVSGGGASKVYRRGVAIVKDNDWQGGCLNWGLLVKVLLE